MLIFSSDSIKGFVYVKEDVGNIFFMTDTMNIGSISIIKYKLSLSNNTLITNSLVADKFFVFTFGNLPGVLEVNFLGSLIDCDREFPLSFNLVQYYFLNSAARRLLPMLIFIYPSLFLGYLVKVDLEASIAESGLQIFLRGQANFNVVA